jgi:hypothetical protein
LARYLRSARPSLLKKPGNTNDTTFADGIGGCGGTAAGAAEDGACFRGGALGLVGISAGGTGGRIGSGVGLSVGATGVRYSIGLLVR